MTRRATPEECADHDRDLRKHDDAPAQTVAEWRTKGIQPDPRAAAMVAEAAAISEEFDDYQLRDL